MCVLMVCVLALASEGLNFSPGSVKSTTPGLQRTLTLFAIEDVVVEQSLSPHPGSTKLAEEFAGMVVPTQIETMVVPACVDTAPRGLLQALRGGAQSQKARAADLFKRYGAAYLLCSLSLSACSFGLFVLLVRGGIDAGALLRVVGITLRAGHESLGTYALAYLLHKAASPIRFPPTVALTVALGRLMDGSNASDAKARRARAKTA